MSLLALVHQSTTCSIDSGFIEPSAQTQNSPAALGLNPLALAANAQPPPIVMYFPPGGVGSLKTPYLKSGAPSRAAPGLRHHRTAHDGWHAGNGGCTPGMFSGIAHWGGMTWVHVSLSVSLPCWRKERNSTGCAAWRCFTRSVMRQVPFASLRYALRSTISPLALAVRTAFTTASAGSASSDGPVKSTTYWCSLGASASKPRPTRDCVTQAPGGRCCC